MKKSLIVLVLGVFCVLTTSAFAATDSSMSTVTASPAAAPAGSVKIAGHSKPHSTKTVNSKAKSTKTKSTKNAAAVKAKSDVNAAKTSSATDAVATTTTTPVR